jgi:hypothetical protein
MRCTDVVGQLSVAVVAHRQRARFRCRWWKTRVQRLHMGVRDKAVNYLFATARPIGNHRTNSSESLSTVVLPTTPKRPEELRVRMVDVEQQLNMRHTF